MKTSQFELTMSICHLFNIFLKLTWYIKTGSLQYDLQVVCSNDDPGLNYFTSISYFVPYPLHIGKKFILEAIQVGLTFIFCGASKKEIFKICFSFCFV